MCSSLYPTTGSCYHFTWTITQGEAPHGGPTLFDSVRDCWCSTLVAACYGPCATWRLRWILTNVLLGLSLMPTTMAPIVRYVPSWRRRQVPMCCYLVESLLSGQLHAFMGVLCSPFSVLWLSSALSRVRCWSCVVSERILLYPLWVVIYISTVQYIQVGNSLSPYWLIKKMTQGEKKSDM